MSPSQGAAATLPPRLGCNQRHTKKIPQPSPSSLPLLVFGSRLPLRHQAIPQPRQRQRDQLAHGIQAALILESLQSQPRNASLLLVSQAGIGGAAACSIYNGAPLSPFALCKCDGGKGFISTMRRTRKQLLVHYLRRACVRAGAVLLKVEQPNKRVMGRNSSKTGNQHRGLRG